jgi:hypothetical protein
MKGASKEDTVVEQDIAAIGFKPSGRDRLSLPLSWGLFRQPYPETRQNWSVYRPQDALMGYMKTI